MATHRGTVPLLLLLVLASAGSAQLPDSVQRLPPIGVTVTRRAEPLDEVDAAITVLDSATFRRLRLTPSLDEALAGVPGVIVWNRGNYSVDQRLAIRGFGARANFGLRGVKVLLDGVPQTLPDGQSQLTNLDLGSVARIEVLRGAASALYGNASGGVISFQTAPFPAAGLQVAARAEGGALGSWREGLSLAARHGDVGGTITASRFVTDGARLHSATEQRRLNTGIDWELSPHTTITLRAAVADDPRAQNPGALTFAEYASNPDSAAASSILRNADKAVRQSQLALGVRGDAGHVGFEATIYGLTRHLENPLATPPPAPALPTEGTWVGIDRRDGGARATATVPIGATRVTLGVDFQALRDDRVNRRANGGIPEDQLLIDQREIVTEFGPFAQVAWRALPRLTLRAGIRSDRNRFRVEDHLLSDGDASGARTMAATSGNAGVAFRLAPSITAWTDLATLFETPTTTELANRPTNDGGFNSSLDPQRSLSAEAGMRAIAGGFSIEGAVYRTTTRDAIVPYREVGGRTYYRNAGHTRTAGAEFGAAVALRPDWSLSATWTLTDAIFTDYEIIDGATHDRLDGHRLAGIPRQVARVALRGRIADRLLVDLDQSFSSMMYADDDNAIAVAGWGSGVTGLRLAWQPGASTTMVAPYLAALNLFNRRYVGSVSINGSGGRVLEPAAGRTVYLGASVGFTRR